MSWNEPDLEWWEKEEPVDEIEGQPMDCTEDDPFEFQAKWDAEDEADFRVTEAIEEMEDGTERYISRKPAQYELFSAHEYRLSFPEVA